MFGPSRTVAREQYRSPLCEVLNDRDEASPHHLLIGYRTVPGRHSQQNPIDRKPL